MTKIQPLQSIYVNNIMLTDLKSLKILTYTINVQLENETYSNVVRTLNTINRVCTCTNTCTCET